MISEDELEATLARCSLRLKHVLLLMRYVPDGEVYIARNCRVRIARQLEERGLVKCTPHGTLNWLCCVPTPDGEEALVRLAEKLRVRLGKNSVAERTGLV